MSGQTRERVLRWSIRAARLSPLLLWLLAVIPSRSGLTGAPLGWAHALEAWAVGDVVLLAGALTGTPFAFPWLLGLLIPASIAVSTGVDWGDRRQAARSGLDTALHWLVAVAAYVLVTLNGPFVFFIALVAPLALLARTDLWTRTPGLRRAAVLALCVGLALLLAWGRGGDGALWIVAAAVLWWRLNRPEPVTRPPHGTVWALLLLGALDVLVHHSVPGADGGPRLDPGVDSLAPITDAYDACVLDDERLVFTTKMGDGDGSGLGTQPLSDPEARRIVSPAFRGLRLLCLQGGRVLAGNDWARERSGDLYRVDPGTLASEPAPCPEPNQPGGCRYNARFMALDAGGKALLTVAQHPRPTVVRRRLSDLGVLRVQAMDVVHAGPITVDTSGRRAWMLDLAQPSIAILELNADTLETVRRVTAAPLTRELQFHPVTRRLYVARTGHASVLELDPDTLLTLRVLPAQAGPRELLPDASRPLLYVGNYYAGTISVINLDTGQAHAHIRVGPLVRGLATGPGPDTLLAATGAGVVLVDLRVALDATGKERPLLGLGSVWGLWRLTFDHLYAYGRLLEDVPGVGMGQSR